ncbi:MAG TPA: DUF4199 domain-containing protein [Vicinamibacterales bacterium]|nr:DUF4199 domain-containing protein [Vicinamibacterales bacterium]
MTQHVLTFGLLSGVVAAVMMAATMPFVESIGFDRMLVVGYTSIVISMLFVYFGIRSYRDNVLGGTISFGRGFQAGLLITLISCVFYVATWLVLYYAFIPDFGDKYAAYLIADLRASGGSEAEVAALIKQTEVYKEWFRNPFMNAAIAFTEPFPVGLLVTVISAAVLKRRSP